MKIKKVTDYFVQIESFHCPHFVKIKYLEFALFQIELVLYFKKKIVLCFIHFPFASDGNNF